MLKMEGSFKLSVLETQQAFLQIGVPYSGTLRRNFYSFLLCSCPNLAREAAVESKQKCVVFCRDLINTVLASP